MTRTISWIKAARKEFETFPLTVREHGLDALEFAALGGMPDVAKPLHGLGSGVMELVLKDRSGAFRVVYAVQMGQSLWVVHAFQKKSTSGIKTPKHEIEVVKERLRRLKEELR